MGGEVNPELAHLTFQEPFIGLQISSGTRKLFLPLLLIKQNKIARRTLCIPSVQAHHERVPTASIQIVPIEPCLISDAISEVANLWKHEETKPERRFK
jgi:hypothetical protein